MIFVDDMYLYPMGQFGRAMVMMQRAGRRMGTPETAIDRYLAWKDSHAAPSSRRRRA